MKKILITGANSYIGMSLEQYLAQWPDRYCVDTVDMIDGSWKEKSFSGYDVVFHVAGIVHTLRDKTDPKKAELYARVNTNLAIDTARKAKAEGVGQFIFMSSASVYGEDTPIGRTVMITKDTPLAPADNYGISKARAEEGIRQLEAEAFKIVILRPPMIYGKGCKGNYRLLSKLTRKLPVFPWVDNQRSMLYIENFVEFVRLMVDNEETGIFWPQNEEYTNTSEMVTMIAQARGKKILVLKGFTWALKLLAHATVLVNKAFGSLCYDQQISRYKQNYCIKNLAQSVRETESE